MASGGKESDGSDGEIRRPFNTGKKNCKKITSSESDEDSDVELRPKKVKPLQCESEASADELKEIISDHRSGVEASTDLSDNEQSEKCAICLSKFLGQDIATPETCDHVFCLECLQEWAKNVNTCPIDRLKFNIILIRHHKEEKIIKKIFVNNSELPYNSELESESNTESQANFCEVCNEEEGDESLLLCHECQKFYHYACIRTQCNPHMDFWQCPTCESYIRIRDKCLLDFHRVLQSIKRRFSNSRTFPRSRISQTAMSQALRNPHSTRELARVRQRFLYQKSLVRSILSTSESSDEELDHGSTNSPFFQNQVVTNGTKSRCPLMSTKRRNELYRARNQRLLTSATTAATTNSQSHYTMDSDEGYSDFRLPSSPTTENFDVVGSILQSQSLLHSPDVLTVSRDGSVLRNSSVKTRTLLNLDSMFPLTVSEENSETESPFAISSFFSDNAVSPYINKAVGKQIPLHSTQSSSKYGETPRQNYSCSSSSAPRERSLSYDECILSGSTFSGGGNERYNNEPSSPTGPKSFCCTSTSDDMKKVQPSNKDNKSHHSEDEVDIYSDIESVGEEDNSLSDQVEPVKISYKCMEESQQSDTNDVSDSTDNELVIDEDMPAEEETDRTTEPQGFACSKSNNVTADANASYQVDIDGDRSSSPILNQNYDANVNRISLKRSSCEENRKKHDSPNAQNESCSDDENQESDMEVQDEENSVDSTRKSYQGCGSNSCSVKSSPKSLTQCENSNYNENDFCENDNSALETVGKNTPEALNSCTNDNTNDSVSQMEVDEFHENTSNVSDSTSHAEQPYKHKKYNFCVANERNEVSRVDSNENSQPGANSNSSSAHFPINNRILPEESAISQSENNSHFSFSSNQQNADRSEPEDGGDSNDSNCGDSQAENTAAFNFKDSEQHIEQGETEECMDENSQNDVGEYMDENSINETQPDPEFSKDKNDDSDCDNQAGSQQNLSVDNDSQFNFSSRHQNDDESDVEDITDSNPPPSQGVTGTVTTETINISNDETVKSDNEYEDCESFEDASTPCLDENLEGEIENSPVQNAHCENANQDFSRTPDYEYENDAPEKHEDNADKNDPSDTVKDGDVDLGIEDISEAGSEDLDEFSEEPTSEKVKSDHHQTKASEATESSSRFASDDSKKFSNQVFEDQEEGEIIEEKPPRETERRKRDRYYDDSGDYGERAPRMSISDLPRIPKLKRNREKDTVQEPPPFENKRTSVLSRVDLGAGDVSWKRLSKHTRERSYRDGRPKDERLLYRERESRNKDRKNFENNRRADSKSNDRRHDDKKKSSEKSKNDSRSRKNDKSKDDWDYSDRDKKKYHKDHKDRHTKEKHSKDRKDKHDKNRHSKEESKYDREKVKDDSRYERDSRYDKEERFERAIYEKTKSKEKEHKSKRKDRKDDNSKATKDHSREKHKHSHPHESYLDKQREVRKIDDKLKIVVEQKERKEKLKTKDRKDPKLEKELHTRKRETERNAYSEMTSIESKEIFAKGDSIIINVSFNRNSSPKDVSTSDTLDINSSDQILTKEDLDKDTNLNVDSKNKSKNLDKNKTSLDSLPLKRPVTPPERPNQVLSVSESYWQGGDDPDGNNSVASDKSDEESHPDDGNDSVRSAIDADNFSNSSNSSDDLTNQETKDGTIDMEAKSTVSEELVDKFSKEEDTFISKRRSPRSPSPPSPIDNDSYDPCEPTKSPSPPSMPAAPPLPLSNPKPPPSPELPPLPPEPEPTDVSHEDNHNVLHNQTPPVISSTAQPVTVETQTPSSLAFTGMLLPPPSFLSHTSQANNLSNISTLLPPRTMGFPANNSNILTSNHMHPIMAGNFIHTDTSLPPPPNPPNIPHMTSVPPPPPPPSAIGLISQIRHPQLNVQPPLPPNSILQNLGIAHNLNIPQLQLPPLPHLPPNLCAALANHQSPLPFTSQNLPTSLPSNIPNQQNARFLAPNQVPLMPNQNISNNKPHVMSITQMLSHCQTIPVNSNQKSEQPSKPSTPGEKNEVIDMDVDSPYSPGDCSVDSVNDYSPTGSPLPSTPKETGDIFDTLFSADIRTSEKRPHDSVSKHERSKSRSKGTNESLSKKSKHDHRTDSKSKHSVKMQIEKNKKARKEQKIAEKILKLEDSQLKILDELPSSAVEMQVKEKFLKKLNRQERVIEEVKLALKPFYKSRDVNKEEYKDILRRAVPKICHNKSGEINPVKVKYLVECYIKKVRHSKKRSDKKKSKFS